MNESPAATVSTSGVEKSSPAKTMAALARLSAVMKALQLLEAEQVIAPESVGKGVRKFVKDNPCINEHFARYIASDPDAAPPATA